MEVFESFMIGVEEQILDPLVTLVALAAFLVFIWGVVDFIRVGATGDEKKDDGKRHMIWGLVGLVIIFGANAIIDIIINTLGG